MPAAAAAVTMSGLALGSVLLTAPAAQAAPRVSAQDTTWVKSNAQTDLAEIAIGKIAEQRATHAATKKIARITMSDHVKALAELKKVASKASITLPTAPNAVQKAQAAALKTVASGQFDVTYDSDQVKGHELSISQTNTEIADGSSAAVKKYASVYLPVAQKHLRMAEMGYAALTGTSAAPAVGAGTGGMAATHPADDAPWLAVGLLGILVLAGTGTLGLRRRMTGR